MMAAIGIAVGITGFLLHLLIHILAVIKIASTRCGLLEREQMGVE